MSSPSSSSSSSSSVLDPEGARAWRTFIETSYAILDILEVELRAAEGFSLGWLDVLIQLEEAPDGLRMTELADRILQSRSGLTRIVDRMIEAGLIRRERPEDDRRVVLVFLTDGGRVALEAGRATHRPGIQRHFLDHLTQEEVGVLTDVLEKVRRHARDLRPGRVSGGA